MCYERQAIGFYYEHDGESAKLYARPVYAADDESGGGGLDSSSYCGSLSAAQHLKSSVWRHQQSCVHQACAAARRPRQVYFLRNF